MDVLRPTRIAVVGAGPTGLLTALLLRQRGLEVTLFGNVQTEDEHRRTAALLQGSVSLIERAGAWDAVMPHATPLRTMRLVDDTGRLFAAPTATFHAEEIGHAAFGYNVGTAALSQALADCYEGSWVDAPVEAVAVGDGASLMAGGKEYDADLVIGADGRASSVREGAGIGTWHWSYHQSALVTVLSHELDHRETSTEFHRSDGPFVLVPMQGRSSSVVYCGRPGAIAAMADSPDETIVKTLGDACHWLLGEMTLATPTQVYPLSSFVAKAFAKGPVALVGEAAHGFPPIGAQGLNLGLRDVKALVETLAADASTAGLRDYAASRRADVASRTAGVDALNRSLLTSSLPVQASRALGLSAMKRSRALRRLLMQEGLHPLLGG